MQAHAQVSCSSRRRNRQERGEARLYWGQVCCAGNQERWDKVAVAAATAIAKQEEEAAGTGSRGGRGGFIGVRCVVQGIRINVTKQQQQQQQQQQQKWEVSLRSAGACTGEQQQQEEEQADEPERA